MVLLYRPIVLYEIVNAGQNGRRRKTVRKVLVLGLFFSLVLALASVGCASKSSVNKLESRVTRVEVGNEEAHTKIAGVNTGLEVTNENVNNLGNRVGEVETLGVRVGEAEVDITNLANELARKLPREQMIEVLSELYGLDSNLDEETKKLVQNIRDAGYAKLAREVLAKELKVPLEELARLNERLTNAETKLAAPTPTPTATRAPAPTPTATTAPAPTATPVPVRTVIPTAAPIPTRVAPSPTPTKTPVPTRVGVTDIPKETVFTLKVELDKNGDNKVLAIVSNLRDWADDPGCPNDALAQRPETSLEWVRCLTTKDRLTEWLGVSEVPTPGEEWLVLDKTVFAVSKVKEEPLGRQPAFWVEIRPSSLADHLLVELEAGAVKLTGAADPGGETIQPNGRFLERDRYVGWMTKWTVGKWARGEPPNYQKPGVYAVYPLLTER
ncbi:MAG: hypothetical protein A2842_02195 [Candidatus Wildermuthbacteria bacterium RIFCSPHIGHO2_01_FULL_48_25]|uniref:Uncharacterized protein n=1 Tax=Candidatus Wildermuthbacteria bacterium RIFCSPLOWO2_01_FULL_48_16 TaxID=1802461 RepID=A0A1G2RL28_9BACT|nr:MAG: hypothetical protein A2842_02195 [Candidatus Wildermuthbacteria bacterium RIFCSPHIGHO2_01_FULL_48_25]OHA69338.1 MAG: hypothetical protein A3J57_02040 [Candidatus Wildermuthbacteria bacterium RIFCSPHIGHO2_02_FULL_49_12b]OHA73188.1 MAG: hypothetical protein A3B24_00920 [Candidatus Wildermuthbacteria bacterium RIFCSPLOWO2_01_FULL_48_16]